MNLINPQNNCNDITPTNFEKLAETDSLLIMYELQKSLQVRLGQMKKYEESNMYEKMAYVKDNIIHIMVEMSELLERLPFKHWKKYSEDTKAGWVSNEQRSETIFEYIDALHFFLNIAIILGITPEEIYQFYIEKNKENFARQERNY